MKSLNFFDFPFFFGIVPVACSSSLLTLLVNPSSFPLGKASDTVQLCWNEKGRMGANLHFKVMPSESPQIHHSPAPETPQ